MSETIREPAPSKLLRHARVAAIVGIVGLGIAAFMPPMDEPKGTPAEILTNSENYFSPSPRTSNVWAIYAEYAFPPVLLVFYGAGLFARNPRVRSVLGWIACLACFLILLAVSLQIWKAFARSLSRTGFAGVYRSPEELLVLSWFAIAAAITLALLSLCAAPARLRLAGCVALTGLWTLIIFLVILAAWFLTGQGRNFQLLFGYWLSLAASTLIAGGGIVETVILWKRPDLSGKEPA